MSESLDPKQAFLLCDRLSRHFPMDIKKKESIAEKLIQYCVGGYRDGRYWPPHEQTEWVIEYMIDNWPRLDRTAVMRQLVLNNFSLDPPYTIGSKPELACCKCEDSGFDQSKSDRCDCALGQDLHPDVLRIFQHSPKPAQSGTTNNSGSTAAKLEAYGHKRSKRKARPMVKVNKRIVDKLDGKLNPK